MPKRLFKRYMPDHHKIRNNKSLNKVFGTLLHDPNLLHINRRSVSGAMAVGLFYAFVPLPIQMLLAAGTSIFIRVNLPISVGLVWITNPLTIPPMFYFCYKLGTWVLGTPLLEFEFELSWHWLANELEIIWKPFFLGCLISSITASVLGWSAIRLLWRLHVIKHLKQRKSRQKRR